MNVAKAALGMLLLLAASFAAAAGPAIPNAFHGTWSVSAGSCEPSESMVVDETEMMFGETGFFVDLVQPLNAREAVIVASQPRESATQGTVRLHLRVSADAKTLSLMEPNGTVTMRYRCAGPR